MGRSLYLMHYGVKGMKWGVRRYQNPDGSLTAAGRERYRKNSGSTGATSSTRDTNQKQYEAFNWTTGELVPIDKDTSRAIDKIANLNDIRKMVDEYIGERYVDSFNFTDEEYEKAAETYTKAMIAIEKEFPDLTIYATGGGGGHRQWEFNKNGNNYIVSIDDRTGEVEVEVEDEW